MTAWKTRTDEATNRARIYGLLAAVFRAEPSDALIKELRAPDFRDALADMGVSLGSEFHDLPSNQLRESLAIEYTRLFIGPGSHVSPHESIFINVDGSEGGLWGQKTVKVKKFIESAGYVYEPTFPSLPDHISAELEFMQKLAEAEAGLWSNGESERAAWCLRVQQKFIDEHLGNWLADFSSSVTKRAEMPFYRGMAELAYGFVEFDRETIAEMLAKAA